MPDAALFISYGHNDMQPVNWLERLKLYLAPLRRHERVDVWDDSKILTGSDWHKEISDAMGRASAAILLVGPGFLASEFVTNHELPKLLDAARTRGMRIYPLVIGYCGYRLSDLGKYQAFNDPDTPLEAMTIADQNKLLNQVCLSVDKDLRDHSSVAKPTHGLKKDVSQAMEEIAKELENTGTAFVAQYRRRDALVKMIKKRLKVRENLEYENFFFRFYKQLNDEEKFQFDQIRAMTEGPLFEGNQKILQAIENNPKVLEELPALADLRQHLVFWLNKHEKVFTRTPAMCLLYTGVEDGVPFPNEVDEQVSEWIEKHS